MGGADGWIEQAKTGGLSAAAEKRFRRTFDYSDPQTGLRAHTYGVHASPEGEVRAHIEILDKDGRKVGSALRSVTTSADGTPRVQHVSFTLDEPVRSGGFSSRWLQQAENQYRDAGIKEIGLNAANVGAYAWAKAGFEFDNPFSATPIAERFRTALNAAEIQQDLPPEVLTQGRELVQRTDRAFAKAMEQRSFDMDDFPLPLEFAMLGWTPGATDWIGKKLMIGSGWQGVKRL